MNSIGSSMRDRNNNLDFIRLVAGILVVFSHSFPLSIGYIDGLDSDPLRIITGRFSFGKLAVIIFFIISGFLITLSFDRSKDPVYFMKCRILRIMPGLIFVTMLTVLILGPLVSAKDFLDYYGSKSTWLYWKNITLTGVVYELPGVFQENAFPKTVNGSLWTLMFELRFYLLVFILGVTKLLNKKIILLLFVLAILMYIMGYSKRNFEMFSYFSSGMLCYFFRDHIKLHKYFAIPSSLVLMICLFFYQSYLFPFLVISFAYVVMYLAYNSRIKLNIVHKLGDLSYGIYIFSFPIQQTVTHLHGGRMTWWGNFIISLPFILVMAEISWHLIEKNAMKLKNRPLAGRPKIATRGDRYDTKTSA